MINRWSLLLVVTFAVDAPFAVQAVQADAIPAAPEDGWPLNWAVMADGGLKLRAGASTSADVVATLPTGAILDNLGCQHV